MENKHIGWLIIGVAVVLAGIILLFGEAMQRIVIEGCPIARETGECPSQGALTQQMYLSLAIVVLLIVVGVFLVFSKPATKIITKRQNEKKSKININEYTKEEKSVIQLLIENKALFQADIVDKTGFAKVKVTRILDKLEGRGIIERKRRGLNNLVVLL